MINATEVFGVVSMFGNYLVMILAVSSAVASVKGTLGEAHQECIELQRIAHIETFLRKGNVEIGRLDRSARAAYHIFNNRDRIKTLVALHKVYSLHRMSDNKEEDLVEELRLCIDQSKELKEEIQLSQSSKWKCSVDLACAIGHIIEPGWRRVLQIDRDFGIFVQKCRDEYVRLVAQALPPFSRIFPYLDPPVGPQFSRLHHMLRRMRHHLQAEAPELLEPLEHARSQNDIKAFVVALDPLKEVFANGKQDILLPLYINPNDIWSDLLSAVWKKPVLQPASVIEAMVSVGQDEFLVVKLSMSYVKMFDAFAKDSERKATMDSLRNHECVSMLGKFVLGGKYAAEVCAKIAQHCPKLLYWYTFYLDARGGCNWWEVMQSALPFQPSASDPTVGGLDGERMYFVRALQRARAQIISEPVDFDEVLSYMEFLSGLERSDVRDEQFSSMCAMLSAKLAQQGVPVIWHDRSNISNLTVGKIGQMVSYLENCCRKKTRFVYQCILQCLPNQDACYMQRVIAGLRQGAPYKVWCSGEEGLSHLMAIVAVCDNNDIAKSYAQYLTFLPVETWWQWRYDTECCSKTETQADCVAEVIWDVIQEQSVSFDGAYAVLKLFVTGHAIDKTRATREIKKITHYLAEHGKGKEASSALTIDSRLLTGEASDRAQFALRCLSAPGYQSRVIVKPINIGPFTFSWISRP